MEELRSTEILDKEIQADARKNAERILQKADADANKFLSSVDERLEKAQSEKKAKYEERIASYQKDKSAALPLEKDRFLVSYIQTAIEQATDEYLCILGADKRLQLVLKQLSKYEDNLKSKKVFVYIYGFDADAVKKAVGKKLDVVSYETTEFNKLIVENECGLTNKEGVIVEAEDKSIRIRLTLSEIVTVIHDNYRAQLYQALFGERLEK